MLPTEMQALLARQLDVTPVLVGTFARRLREAGILSKLGRGSAAARMGVADAAVLLVAVAGATSPVEAVDQVAAYGRTRLRRATGHGVLRDLGLCRDGLSGRDAVLAVMGAAADGSLDTILRQAGIRAEHAAAAFEASFLVTPPVAVQIRFSGYRGESAREALDFVTDAPKAAIARMRTLRSVEGGALVNLGRALKA